MVSMLFNARLIIWFDLFVVIEFRIPRDAFKGRIYKLLFCLLVEHFKQNVKEFFGFNTYLLN